MITLNCSCGPTKSTKSESVEQLSDAVTGLGGAAASASGRFNCHFDQGKVTATIGAKAAANSGMDQARVIPSSAITKIEFVKKLKTEGQSGQPGKVLGHIIIGPDSGADDETSVTVSVAEWNQTYRYATSQNGEFPIESELVLGQEFEFVVEIQMSTDIAQWGGASSGNRDITIAFWALTDIGNDSVGIVEIPFDGALGATTGT